MREILFRGKRDDTGEWIEGDLRQDKDIGTSYISGYDYYTSGEGLQRDPFEYKVIPETVGQYTGLTDKNGTKIFEGDVVDILTENSDIGIVKYDEGGFEVEADGFVIDFKQNINGTDVAVIGNSYDDPNCRKENKMASIKDLKKMCSACHDCERCPMSRYLCTPEDLPDNADEIVDKWVAEHPIKTYAMDFFWKVPECAEKR